MSNQTFHFSALTPLIGRQEGYLAVKTFHRDYFFFSTLVFQFSKMISIYSFY